MLFRSEMGVKAVVAVYNAAARPVAVECMDDSYIASYDVAVNKAYTVVSLKMSTMELKPLAQPGGALYGIQSVSYTHLADVFRGHKALADAGGSAEKFIVRNFDGDIAIIGGNHPLIINSLANVTDLLFDFIL